MPRYFVVVFKVYITAMCRERGEVEGGGGCGGSWGGGGEGCTRTCGSCMHYILTVVFDN